MTDADPDTHDLAVAVQGAVDAVTRLDHEREIGDLSHVLRQELARRGVEIADDEWLAEAADHIRGGRTVVVDDPP